MFSGGDYQEVARWLKTFLNAHAKRVDPRVEALVEAEGPREGQSFGARLRFRDTLMPPATEPPLELSYPEVAANRGSLAWCGALAERVRTLAREAVSAARQPA